MPKRFKFRFSGVLPAFCRPSKHTNSDLPSDPFLSFLHHVSCLRLPSAAENSSDLNWTKSHNWHVLDTDSALPRRKIYNSAASDDNEEEEEEKAQIVTLPPPRGNRRRRISRKKSISSTDSGIFSEDDHQIVETLVSNSISSRSFSTDSSADFSPHLETIRETPAIRSKRRKKKRRTKKKVKLGGSRSPEEDEDYTAARLSAVFRRLVPCTAVGVEGKVRESMAVVKRSEEPYEDFKKSMVEMIVEKEMVEEKDLQELLRCFLSLNSEQHHGIIIRAFDDIVMSSPALFISESTIG